MNRRTVIAIAIAPLWIVLYAILFEIIAWTRPDDILHETSVLGIIGISAAVGFLIAYIYMLTTGIPFHFLLKATRRNCLHQYVISFFIGGVIFRLIGVAAVWLWTAYQDNLGLGIVGQQLNDAIVHRPTRLLTLGVVAALVGSTFWLITRPDLQVSSED